MLYCVRRKDIEKLYANCEILKPQKDKYPDTLGDMTSTYVTDFPQDFISELNADAEGEEIKLVRADTEQNPK